jgi:hypothetical protein
MKAQCERLVSVRNFGFGWVGSETDTEQLLAGGDTHAARLLSKALTNPDSYWRGSLRLSSMPWGSPALIFKERILFSLLATEIPVSKSCVFSKCLKKVPPEKWDVFSFLSLFVPLFWHCRWSRRKNI